VETLSDRVVGHNGGMKPRSIVFTLFGDYLRYCGGEARLGAISELLSLFDVDPGTTRVVMTRLRNDGWFETERQGRETVYRLSAAGWRLLDEGRERIFQHPLSSWSGKWSMVLVRFPETHRAARDESRRALSWLGYGQLTSSTWMSPHDRLEAVERSLAGSPALTLDLLTCESRGLEHDRSIARRCWDLNSLNADYGAFLKKYEPIGDVGGLTALELRVALTNDYRHFPFRDPDLPVELVPEGWLGHRAHEVFRGLHARLASASESEVERIAEVHIDHDSYLQQLLDDRRDFVTQSGSPVIANPAEAIID
jgi:phenylacetic acid degradation operon negative regulatory protein